MALYKSLGLSTLCLRVSFALRFLLAALPGLLVGLLASSLWADAAVGSIFRRFGIGAFAPGRAFWPAHCRLSLCPHSFSALPLGFLPG